MPDFGCIRVDYITPKLTYDLPQLTDKKGRDWYYIEIPQLTEALNEEFGGSEYSWVGWLCMRWNPVISALGLPALSIFGDWPEGINELLWLVVEVSGVNESQLSKALSKEKEVEENVPIYLTKFKGEGFSDELVPKLDNSSFEGESIGDQRLNRKSHNMTPHLEKTNEIEEELKNKIIKICEQHKDEGWEIYFTGKYKSNGYNYAKDIVYAAEYARELLSEVDKLSVSIFISLINSRRREYESINEDMEGFGDGTLTSIIEAIQAIEE